MGCVYESADVQQATPTIKRPPEGLARGLYEAPPWLIATLAALVAAVALALVIVWLRRSRAARLQ